MKFEALPFDEWFAEVKRIAGEVGYAHIIEDADAETFRLQYHALDMRPEEAVIEHFKEHCRETE